MTDSERRRLATEAVRDLGITPRNTKGEIPLPPELAEGSIASLAERARARDAYLQQLLSANSLTSDQKKWLGGQLADFGREGGFDQ